jgi:hypothetical protein
MAKSFDIKIQQGATFSLGVTIKDSSGSPIDLSGYSFKGQIRRNASSDKVEASFLIDVQDQISSPGRVTVRLPPGATRAIKVDASTDAGRKITRMAYDIEFTRPDQTVVRMLEGVVLISPEVTR